MQITVNILHLLRYMKREDFYILPTNTRQGVLEGAIHIGLAFV